MNGKPEKYLIKTFFFARLSESACTLAACFHSATRFL